jgi:hypothetical protein
MGTKIAERRLYELIKKAVDEALKANLKRLKIALIPYADDAEMEGIRKIFGSPRKYKNQPCTRRKL